MFAPRVTRLKAQSITYSPPSNSARHRSAHGAVERIRLLQRTIGNQATTRLLAQRATRDNELGDAWGFTRSPESTPERKDRPEAQSPLAAPSHAPRTAAGNVPAAAREAPHSPGQPLDVPTRAYFEPRFGFDFSQVRIHDDSQAHRSAAEINAKAFTFDHHIVFGQRAYAPGTEEGRRLIAHELTHIVQQRHTRPSASWPSVTDPKDPAERQATAAAESVTRGTVINLTPVFPTGRRQRQVVDLEMPSAEAPGLTKATVEVVNAHLKKHDWQQALDVIVNELARKGEIDRSLIEGGRMFFARFTVHDGVRRPLEGEGETDPKGFRRTAKGGLKSVRHPVVIGRDAFTRGVPWLYRTILHEYHHILQLKDPRKLPTTETTVPGQAANKVLIDQQEVETYCEIILQAHLTGESTRPRDIREDWKRAHDHWSKLGPSERKAVRDIYIRAHTAAEAILGGPGTLPHYAPGSP